MSPPIVLEDEELIKFIMRSLNSAQRLYRGNPAQGAGNYADSFMQLYRARVIDLDLSDGIYGGYQFEMFVQNTKQTASFQVRAIPIVYGKTGIRSCYVDKISPLRGADKGGNYADENDPVIEH